MRILPSNRESVVDSNGQATRAWYSWFSRVDAAATEGLLPDAAARAGVAAIATALGSPDGSVAGIPPHAGQAVYTGVQSVTVTGTSLALRGDTPSPPTTSYYGTDTSGAKGFFPLSDALIQGANITLSVGADGRITVASSASAETHNRIDPNGDIRKAADGSLRITP